MNTFILLYIVIFSITLGAWNAYVILWGVYKNLPNWNTLREKFSKRWHVIGWILRFEMAILIGYLLFFHPGQEFDWWLTLNWASSFLIMMAFQYDFTINLIRMLEAGYPDLWYVDDKGVNAVFLKVFKTEASVWWFRLILLVLTVASWIGYGVAY